MHQLTKWEIDKQGGDQKDMDIKNGTDMTSYCGVKGCKTHGQLFYIYDISTYKIAHQATGGGDGKDEKKRKIIGWQGDKSYLGQKNPTAKKQGKTAQNNQVTYHDGRSANLQKSVSEAQDRNKERHGIGKEPHMAQNDNQKGVMEHEPEEPEILTGAVTQFRAVIYVRLSVTKQGTEKKDLKEHPLQDTAHG